MIQLQIAYLTCIYISFLLAKYWHVRYDCLIILLFGAVWSSVYFHSARGGHFNDKVTPASIFVGLFLTWTFCKTEDECRPIVILDDKYYTVIGKCSFYKVTSKMLLRQEKAKLMKQRSKTSERQY